jgi:[acyl-carrier-protein] S-malonyltransferase
MKKIALLFPGQGSQFVGMGKDMYNNFQKGREIFEEANETLGFDLKKLCFEGPIDELTKTINAQPAILTVSYLCYQKFLEMFDIEPSFLAGHSLGEYSALLCSGVLSFSDSLKIVRKRGEFMQEASKEGVGSMLAIRGLDKKVIEEVCKDVSDENEIVVVSNYNSPLQTVISGHVGAIGKAYKKFESMNGELIELKVSAPFHSPLMKDASKKLRNELMKYKYNELKYPVISNVDGSPYENRIKIISTLTQQLTEPVKWTDSMRYLENQQVDITVELGPQNTLKSLMKANSNKIKSYSLNNKEDITSLKEKIGVTSDSSKKHLKLITRCLAMAVCTRNRNWNNDQYNEGVIKPYNKIQKMQQKIDSDNNIPTVEEMRAAMNLLKTIFDTKKVPIEEQSYRFNKILDETGTREIFKEFIIDI